MSQVYNETSVSPLDLIAIGEAIVIIDVRKPAARSSSGLEVPGSVWRHPFDAVNWAGAFKGRRVVVYCVHGHEVSRAVRGLLEDSGIEARLIEGGFEAWRAAGLPVVPVELSDG
ncbi:rhodanese-like domain-containing protein [Hoeflea sp.]|uniref:rhodanese-like domain-containing protein n=1 Tax=Hoeflea sp. TaxID=1940281 RepID=UPI003BB0770C